MKTENEKLSEALELLLLAKKYITRKNNSYNLNNKIKIRSNIINFLKEV